MPTDGKGKDTSILPKDVYMTCQELDEMYKCRIFRSMFPPNEQPVLGNTWIYIKDATSFYFCIYVPYDFEPLPNCASIGTRAVFNRIYFINPDDTTSLGCSNL